MPSRKSQHRRRMWSNVVFGRQNWQFCLDESQCICALCSALSQNEYFIFLPQMSGQLKSISLVSSAPPKVWGIDGENQSGKAGLFCSANELFGYRSILVDVQLQFVLQLLQCIPSIPPETIMSSLSALFRQFSPAVQWKECCKSSEFLFRRPLN